MAVDRSHEAVNDAARGRLRALIGRLSDADLARPLPGSWTIAASLAHAAYWDARAIFWIDSWGPDGTPSTPEPENVDAVNDAAKPLCLALRPRDAAELALRLAEESDRTVAGLSDAMLAKIEAIGGPPFNLARATHRNEHLDDIEQALAR